MGCGWLGKPLGKFLADAGWKVLGSTTRAENLPILRDHRIHPYLIKFTPAARGEYIEDFFSSDVLIIAMPPRTKHDSGLMFLDTMESTIKCIGLGSVRKVIFISSTSVYPDCDRVVTENDADSNTVLARAEQKLRAVDGLKVSVLRFGGLVGPGRHPGRFLSGKTAECGGNPVNMIHQEDCIRIIERILKDEVWGVTLSACADRHPSKSDYYSAACAQLNVPAPVFTSDGTAALKIVDNTKLKQVLRYEFVFPDPMTMTY